MVWDINVSTYPPTNSVGDLYLCANTGCIGDVLVNLGDYIRYDGSTWVKVSFDSNGNLI